MTAALRVAGSMPVRNKYSYGLEVIVPSLAVCVSNMFVNASTKQVLFREWGNVLFFLIKKLLRILRRKKDTNICPCSLTITYTNYDGKVLISFQKHIRIVTGDIYLVTFKNNKCIKLVTAV